MKRGPYRRYNIDPNTPLPRTTAWNARENILKQILVTDSDDDSDDEGMLIVSGTF